ncbi:hypothetical protein AVEN_252929-1 [Araneus ventricosus]|uniref:Uncharacterized protein n=1 Tax=Araneus ventricosus TaxID=182803 RepID=A0A4Y2FB54_ARAVE|nr:hypothetical protein AVEN_252929-1 [Araneus ventricosus]
MKSVFRRPDLRSQRPKSIFSPSRKSSPFSSLSSSENLSLRSSLFNPHLLPTGVRSRKLLHESPSIMASSNNNEPGTALSAPSAAAVVSPYAAPVAPSVPAAPVVSAPLLAAAPATISSYSTVIGHGATLGLPLGDGLISPVIGKTLIL